mgnify:CR=1 FL=1
MRESFLISVIFICCLTSYLGSAIDVPIELEKLASIEVNKSVLSSSEEKITYLISVSNTGEIKLNNVMVNDMLPPGIKYISSKFRNLDDQFRSICLDIGSENETKSIIWQLGSLETGQQKEIVLSVSKESNNASYWLGKIHAEGLAINNLIQNTKTYRAHISIDIEVFESNNSTKIRFDVRNKGNTTLEKAVITANLENSMKFGNVINFSEEDSKNVREYSINRSDKNSETNITVDLGYIAPEKRISVTLELLSNPEECANMAFEIAGNAYGIAVSDSKNGIILSKCFWRDEDQQPCDHGEGNEECKPQHCDWTFTPR